MVFIAHYQIFVSFERKVLYFRLFKISLIKILEFRNCYFWFRILQIFCIHHDIFQSKICPLKELIQLDLSPQF